jgi:hypothetical protein
MHTLVTDHQELHCTKNFTSLFSDQAMCQTMHIMHALDTYHQQLHPNTSTTTCGRSVESSTHMMSLLSLLCLTIPHRQQYCRTCQNAQPPFARRDTVVTQASVKQQLGSAVCVA